MILECFVHILLFKRILSHLFDWHLFVHRLEIDDAFRLDRGHLTKLVSWHLVCIRVTETWDFGIEFTFSHLFNLGFQFFNCLLHLIMVRLEFGKWNHRLFFVDIKELLDILIRLLKPSEHVFFLLPRLLEIIEIKINPFLQIQRCSDLKELLLKFPFAIWLLKADPCNLFEDIVR